MLVSPLGEKFHFRTTLSLEECKTRIDGLEASILNETNYSKQPVSARRKNRFTLWENQYLRPPRLTGKLATNKSWTEISGRAGANLTSLWSAAGVLFLVAGICIFEAIVEREPMNFVLAGIIAILGAAYMYWRSWEDPYAGHLIDQLQVLLDAEPLPGAVGPSRTR